MSAAGASADLIAALALPAEALCDQRVPRSCCWNRARPPPPTSARFRTASRRSSGSPRSSPPTSACRRFGTTCANIWKSPCSRSYFAARQVAAPYRADPPGHSLSGRAGDRAGDGVSLSLAHKRWSQGETGKVVIEDLRRTASFRPDTPVGRGSRVPCQPGALGPAGRDLLRFIMDGSTAWPRWKRPGSPGILPSRYRRTRSGQRDALDAHARLQHDIAVLRAQAKKEKQLNRRVELNLEIKRLEELN